MWYDLIIHCHFIVDSRRPTREGPIGEGPIGEGPIGEGPIGEGPVGEGPIGEGPTGQGSIGEDPLHTAPHDPGPVSSTVSQTSRSQRSKHQIPLFSNLHPRFPSLGELKHHVVPLFIPFAFMHVCRLFGSPWSHSIHHWSKNSHKLLSCKST